MQRFVPRKLEGVPTLVPTYCPTCTRLHSAPAQSSGPADGARSSVQHTTSRQSGSCTRASRPLRSAIRLYGARCATAANGSQGDRHRLPRPDQIYPAPSSSRKSVTHGLHFCGVHLAPLPRIIQEQIRPQLGMSWGSAKNPNCSGIPVRDLNRVNWDEVDLSEWTDLLDLTGQMPEGPNLTPENLTGSGSGLGGDIPRSDAIERTVDRSEGANIGEENEAARQQIWGQQ